MEINVKNTLSLDTKVKILKRLDEGVSGNRLAQDFNVAKSAISYIKSKKQELMAAVTCTDQESKKKNFTQRRIWENGKVSL